MEQSGKSFTLVLETLEFNILEKKINYPTLGLVFGTRSTWVRDSTYQVVTTYLEYWQDHFSPKILKEIRDTISEFITAKVKIYVKC